MNLNSRAPLSRYHQRGSVLVICMILAALGTIGVAAWFSLLDARGHQVGASFKALERRVALNNSRTLANQAIYSTILHGNTGLAADAVYELPGGKGRATIRAFDAVPLKSDQSGTPSQNGATPLISNTTNVAVELSDGISDTSWTFQLRNYNPALAGELLLVEAPVAYTDSTPLVSGNLRVKGRAVFLDATATDLNNGIKADEFQIPNSIVATTTFSTISNAATLPLNYPHFRRTTGLTSSGPAYGGQMELYSSTINPQNAYESKLDVATVTKLSGSVAKSEANGPATNSATSDDPTLIAMINTSPPDFVADELSKKPSLSSPVLIAAVQKSNPALTNQHFHRIFNAQSSVADDALTVMMASLDEASLDNTLDMAIVDMNIKNGARFNTNGKGMAQIFLDRSELTQVVVEGVTRLRLFGQSDAAKAATAATLSPLLIIVDNRGGQILSNIDLFHGNRRPVIVVMISAPAGPAQPLTTFKGSSAFPEWRLIFDLQNTGLAFDASGVAGSKIIGGIRTNHRVSVTGGTVTLEKDVNGASMMNLLSRDAWIEAVRN
ncbi:MAG: hypothetical protein ABL994_07640 [Verrucomicrobiales bacterium]